MEISPSITDLAWAAGLFEGEGCMAAYERRTKTDIQVRLAMTDEDIVKRFAAVVGVGTIASRQKRPNEKPVFEWYVYSAADVCRVIELLLPWFGERRSAKARYVLEMASRIGPARGARTHCPRGHELVGDNLKLEPITRAGKAYYARRCKTCRQLQERNRARLRLGITPERFRK